MLRAHAKIWAWQDNGELNTYVFQSLKLALTFPCKTREDSSILKLVCLNLREVKHISLTLF